ncbi:MAG: DUF4214 domain-containing protein [Lamprobacter sp.]|uniref:DUF4214 domain-containing protein n=1 Tax=Lamprobacter sp. TaxID=3100796 RepID=UPI002B25DE44|nr:DUF4214 domain-containing protein [Lamprobacter sp.]MEA3641305.1 DUF4214 domain-containing protein [Lamprobacter sp.]
MARQLDLSIRIAADGRAAAGEIERVERQLRRVRPSAEQSSRAMAGMSAAVKGLGAAAAAVAIAKIGGALSDIAREADQAQRNMLRTEAILKATGHTAGLTAQQLKDNASALALATLQSVEGVEQAQQILLTFRSVSGDTFTRATELAADLATVTGGNLNSAMTQLGKALEDPVKGLNAMTRSGVSFTEAQKEIIKTLAETNRQAEAQAMILDELARQYGGVARKEAEGYAGAVDTLGQRMQELKLEIADSTGLLDFMTDATNLVTRAVEGLTASIKDGVIGDEIQRWGDAASGVSILANKVGDLAVAAGNLIEKIPGLNAVTNALDGISNAWLRWSPVGMAGRAIDALSGMGAQQRELATAGAELAEQFIRQNEVLNPFVGYIDDLSATLPTVTVEATALARSAEDLTKNWNLVADKRINATLRERFQQMVEQEGLTGRITSGMRDYNKQWQLYQNYLNGGPLAAKPGTSLHEHGKAIDYVTEGTKRLTKEMAEQYGLKVLLYDNSPHVHLELLESGNKKAKAATAGLTAAQRDAQRQAAAYARAQLSAATALRNGAANIEDYLDGLREEIALSRMTQAEQRAYRVELELTGQARQAELRAIEAAAKGNTALSDALLQVAANYRAAIPEAQGLAAQLDAAGPKINTFATLWTGALEEIGSDIQTHLADAFEDLFNGSLKSAKDFFSDLADIFKRSLAQLAAAVMQNKIVIPIMTTMTGMSGASLAGEAQQAVTGQGGLGGIGGLGSIGQLFTGNSIGQGITSTFSSIGNLAGDVFGKGFGEGFFSTMGGAAGGLPNWAFGAGGFGGSLLGSMLFDGEYVGIASSVGSAVGSAIGPGIAAGLGMALGPVGAIIGGLLGGVGGGFLGSLFGGKQEEPGMLMSVNDGQFGIAAVKGMEQQAVRDVVKQFDQINEGLNQFANQLGLTAEEIESIDLSFGALNVFDPEQFEKDVKNNINSTMSEMLDIALEKQTDTVGAEYAHLLQRIRAETNGDVEAFLGQWQQVDLALANLANQLRATGTSADVAYNGAIRVANAWMNLGGTMEGLAANVGHFYSAFYSEGEQAAMLYEQLSETLTDSMGAAGHAVPQTNAQFRALVESLDVSTEAGANTYASLMRFVPAFDAMTQAQERAQQEMQQQAQQAQQEMQQQAQQAQQESERAQQEAERVADAIASKEIELMRLQGDAAAALALEREMELDALRETSDALVSLQEEIWALQDAAQWDEAIESFDPKTFTHLANEAVMPLLRVGLLLPETADGFADLMRSAELTDDQMAAMADNLPAYRAYYTELENRQSAMRNVEIDSLNLTGDEIEAVALQRQNEYDALYAVNPALAEATANLWELQDAANALKAPDIAGLYQSLFGRSADAAGLQWHTGEGYQSQGQAEAAMLINASAEDLKNTVDIAYEKLFGRLADSEGLDYWIQQIQSGAITSIEQFENALMLGANDLDLLANELAEKLSFSDILSAYQSTLGRTADAAGIGYWLAKGLTDQEELKEGILRGAQGDDLNYLIDQAFNQLFGRYGDATGRAYWAKQWAAGVFETWDDLLQAMVEGAGGKDLDRISDRNFEKRRELEIDLLSAQGKEQAAVNLQRKNALEQLPAELRLLQHEVWFAEDLQKTNDQLRSFRDAVNAIGDDIKAYRALKLQDIDPGLRHIQEMIWNAEDLKDRLNEAKGLLSNYYQLVEDTEALREIELESIDEANREYQRLLWELEDAQAIYDEAISLSNQYYSLIGDTATLRERELEAIAPANRELQELIWRIEDLQKAAQEAKGLSDEFQSMRISVLSLIDAEAALEAERQLELNETDAALRPYKEMMWRMQDAAESAKEISNNLAEASSYLENFAKSVEDLRREVSETPEEKEFDYQKLLTRARDGDRDALDDILGTASSYIDSIKKTSATRVDYLLGANNVLKELSELPEKLSPNDLLISAIDNQTRELSGALDSIDVNALLTIADAEAAINFVMDADIPDDLEALALGRLQDITREITLTMSQTSDQFVKNLAAEAAATEILNIRLATEMHSDGLLDGDQFKRMLESSITMEMLMDLQDAVNTEMGVADFENLIHQSNPEVLDLAAKVLSENGSEISLQQYRALLAEGDPEMLMLTAQALADSGSELTLDGYRDLLAATSPQLLDLAAKVLSGGGTELTLSQYRTLLAEGDPGMLSLTASALSDSGSELTLAGYRDLLAAGSPEALELAASVVDNSGGISMAQYQTLLAAGSPEALQLAASVVDNSDANTISLSGLKGLLDANGTITKNMKFLWETENIDTGLHNLLKDQQLNLKQGIKMYLETSTTNAENFTEAGLADLISFANNSSRTISLLGVLSTSLEDHGIDSDEFRDLINGAIAVDAQLSASMEDGALSATELQNLLKSQDGLIREIGLEFGVSGLPKESEDIFETAINAVGEAKRRIDRMLHYGPNFRDMITKSDVREAIGALDQGELDGIWKTEEASEYRRELQGILDNFGQILNPNRSALENWSGMLADMQASLGIDLSTASMDHLLEGLVNDGIITAEIQAEITGLDGVDGWKRDFLAVLGGSNLAEGQLKFLFEDDYFSRLSEVIGSNDFYANLFADLDMLREFIAANIGAFDENSNFTLSFAEFKDYFNDLGVTDDAMLREWFDVLDSNNNGQLEVMKEISTNTVDLSAALTGVESAIGAVESVIVGLDTNLVGAVKTMDTNLVSLLGAINSALDGLAVEEETPPVGLDLDYIAALSKYGGTAKNAIDAGTRQVLAAEAREADQSHLARILDSDNELATNLWNIWSGSHPNNHINDKSGIDRYEQWLGSVVDQYEQYPNPDNFSSWYQMATLALRKWGQKEDYTTFGGTNIAAQEIVDAVQEAGIHRDDKGEFRLIGVEGLERYVRHNYAEGGIHPGGLRLVGERGPELEVTGPSRIMSNEDLMRALQPQPDIQAAPPINLIQSEAGSDPELLAALEELQAELHELRMEQRKQHNASHRELKELREIEEKREVIGQPKIREDA